MHNVYGPNTLANVVVNIAPGEGQLPAQFTSESDWAALVFAKNFATGEKHINNGRNAGIMPSKYLHARLKSCDDRFALDPQYIYQAIDWIERNVASTVHFTERKQFQTDISVGCLQSQDNVMTTKFCIFERDTRDT